MADHDILICVNQGIYRLKIILRITTIFLRSFLCLIAKTFLYWKSWKNDRTPSSVAELVRKYMDEIIFYLISRHQHVLTMGTKQLNNIVYLICLYHVCEKYLKKHQKEKMTKEQQKIAKAFKRTCKYWLIFYRLMLRIRLLEKHGIPIYFIGDNENLARENNENLAHGDNENLACGDNENLAREDINKPGMWGTQQCFWFLY